MSERSASYWIEHLALQAHPEGGHYREVYRARESIAAAALPLRFGADRCMATSIYYLLGRNDRSAFHRIKSDETWHFYAGVALELFQLDEREPEKMLRVVIGNQLHHGQQLQWTVPAGVWFASRPLVDDTRPLGEDTASNGNLDYSLLGCGVSPGFDFADFELASRTEMLKRFPLHGSLIGQLCVH